MSAGFYKKKTETELYYAPNFVKHKDFTLTKEAKNLIDMKETGGWKWFDTSTAAHLYFHVAEKLWTDERIKKLDQMNDLEKLVLLNTADLTPAKIDTDLTPAKIDTEFTEGIISNG